MTRFTGGPAARQVLLLRRAPLYLRVVRARAGKHEWDALDQVVDAPKPGEDVHAYRRTKLNGQVHLCCSKGASGWYVLADYEFVGEQPDEAAMRDNPAWQAWVMGRLAAAGSAGVES
jgi:hypothetical protein